MMRHDNYKDDMYRLDNEYRGLLIQIRFIRRTHDDLPSAEEARVYQRAAEICADIANMNVGAEAEHWKNEQNKCNEKIREIAYYLNPEAAKRAEQRAAENGQSNDSQGTASKASDNSASDGDATMAYGIETNEVVTEAVIKEWFDDKSLNHDFSVVAGMDDVKQKLRHSFSSVGMTKLKAKLGIDPMQSFFFIGPPGCGKTFIIEAFAYELVNKYGYKFMSLNGSKIHSRYVGDAEKIIEKSFEAALANAPCIIFFDEMDGVCRSRNSPNLPGHMFSTTTAFLNGYNKLSSRVNIDKPVIFMAATNYPQDVDIAMLDRTEMIEISFPDAAARAAAFERSFKDHIQLADNITFEDMGAATENYNNRDINRLSGAIRNRIFDRFCASISESGSDAESGTTVAIEALDSGEVNITKELFEEELAKYTPAPKEEYMQKLAEWKDQIKKVQDE